MYETWVEFRIGGHGPCSGTISGAWSHDSPGRPHYRAVFPRSLCGVRSGPEGSPLSVKVMSAVQNSEGAARKKIAAASRDPLRRVRLLRGVEAIGAAEHGYLG